MNVLLNKIIFFSLVFFASGNVFSCPLNCDMSYYQPFVSWSKNSNLWGNESVITSPLDHAIAPYFDSDFHEKWVAFSRKLRKTDTLHFFITDTASRQSLSGKVGYAIIRDGKVVETLITVFY